MTRKLKIIQFGLGEIGLNIAKTITRYDDMFELVGCVDLAPDKVNRDVGELLEPKGIFNLKVAESLGRLKRKKADMVVHSAVSYLPDAALQVEQVMELGYNVVTTAEELFFLRRRDPKLFRRLDGLAKRKRVRLLATGINPGYVMDSLVLMLTAPCVAVSSIRAERMVNLSHRRLALQRKLGVGLTAQEVMERAETGKFGQTGLTDSAEFLAHYLDIKYDNIRSVMQPVVADHDYHGDEVFVAAGHVVGVRQEAVVESSGREIVSLRLTMRIDASIEYDAVFIDGEPPVNVVVNNGIMGDVASVGMVLNQARGLLELPPGYHDMADVRLPHFTMDHIS